MIVLMAGLPGTGKSAVARRLPGFVVDKDVIRAALFEPGLVEYSVTQDDFCQEVMLQTAEYLTARDPGLCVFLDGRTFSRRYQRRRAIDFAERLGAPWLILECVCPEPVALVRLARDVSAGTHPAANRTPELYRAVLASFEPITEPKTIIDTDRDLESCVRLALRAIADARRAQGLRT